MNKEVLRGGPPQAFGVREGQVLIGKYRVERVLRAGGSEAVVVAHHLQLDIRLTLRYVAYVVDLAAPNYDAAFARFARQARAAVQISSEHVARIFEVGTLINGAPYMTTEYLDGVELRALLRERGPRPVDEAVDLVLQACEAVVEAHALGIVHRDLTPANLVCVERPPGRSFVKVLGFGASDPVDAPAPPPTTTLRFETAAIGTPLYMSPEQLEGSPAVDARTDVWSLGVILYELLAGRPPFTGSTLAEVAVKIAMRAPPPLVELRRELPPALASVVATCLSKDRDGRFPNVGDLARSLAPFGSERGRASVQRITDVCPVGDPLATGQPPSPPARRASVTPPVSLDNPAPPPEDAPPAETAWDASPASTPDPASVLSFATVEPAPHPQPSSPEVVAAVFAPALSSSDLAAESAAPPSEVRPRFTGRPSPGVLFVGAVLGVAAVTAFVILSGRPGRPAVSGNAAAAPTLLPSASPERAPASTAASSAVDPPPPSAPLDASSVPAPVASDAPHAGAAPSREAAHESKRPAASSRARALKAECNPSFYFDVMGRKHFKPECFPSTPGASAADGKGDCEATYSLDLQGRKHFKPQCLPGSKP